MKKKKKEDTNRRTESARLKHFSVGVQTGVYTAGPDGRPL